MKKIHIWSVGPDKDGTMTASAVDTVENSETEQKLEDLLVRSPDLLLSNLTLVGRQVPIEGGWIDLLGIDQDGRVAIFELKRGVLTREAVAQVLDYGSDLAELSAERLAKIIEENSGRAGIEKIDDFSDWYGQEYPDNDEPLSEPARMVLVGLGVDDRARRIVNMLADSGLDIQLLTFHAFEIDGQLLLARQVETVPPSPLGGGENRSQTKEERRKVLLETARALGVKDFLEETVDFIDQRMPAYRWPGKTAYSFSLQEKTSEGRPSLRSYVAVYPNQKQPGSLLLRLSPRAAGAAESAFDAFCSEVEGAVPSDKSYAALELPITPETWPSVSGPLEALLTAIVAGWKAKSSAELEKKTDQEAGEEPAGI